MVWTGARPYHPSCVSAFARTAAGRNAKTGATVDAITSPVNQIDGRQEEALLHLIIALELDFRVGRQSRELSRSASLF